MTPQRYFEVIPYLPLPWDDYAAAERSGKGQHHISSDYFGAYFGSDLRLMHMDETLSACWNVPGRSHF